MALDKPVFTRKNGTQKGGRLYKWSPIQEDKKKKPTTTSGNFYCNATPFSQGEDWITTFVYEIVVVDGVAKRIAYVACDYVA